MTVSSTRRLAEAQPWPWRQMRGLATRRSWPRIGGLAVLWVGGLLMVVPFVWMVINSFKSAARDPQPAPHDAP